jgi:hypothetical protein
MKKSLFVMFILSIFFLSPVISEENKKAEDMTLEEVIAEINGNWVGSGASSEVRFRAAHSLLILTVKHETQFIFHIDENGKIEGEGTITYNLERNTSGLDDLAANVRGAIGMFSAVATSTGGKGAGASGSTVKGIDTITNLQYDAPHLKYGKELRHFKFTGNVDAQKAIRLEEVINFTKPNGEPGSTLIAEYEVNNKKEESLFPCWSPFLKDPGILRRGPGGMWLVEFYEEGKHRNNVNVWQEYAYVWMARKVE